MKTNWNVALSAVALALLTVYPSAAEMSSPSHGPDSATGLATPAGQISRYVVTDMSSIVGSGAYATTASVVTVFNNSTTPCSVSVDWFYGHSGSACTSNYVNLPAGHTAVFCTRSTSPQVSACDFVCSPQLTFIQGSARVASTNNANCAKIAVAGRIYYRDSADNQITAITDAKIVKKGLGNNGD